MPCFHHTHPSSLRTQCCILIILLLLVTPLSSPASDDGLSPESKAISQDDAIKAVTEALAAADKARAEASKLAQKDNVVEARKLVDAVMPAIYRADEILSDQRSSSTIDSLRQRLQVTGRKVNFDRYQYRKRMTLSDSGNPTGSFVAVRDSSKTNEPTGPKRIRMRYSPPAQPLSDILDGPSLWLTFDRRTRKNNRLSDLSGRNRHVTVNAAEFTEGFLGEALFIQHSGYLKMGNIINPTSATVMFWFKPLKGHRPKAQPTRQICTLFKDNDNKLAIELYRKGYLAAGVKKEGKWILKFKSHQKFWNERWYHVAFAFDTSGSRLYVNGAKVYATDVVVDLNHLAGKSVVIGNLGTRGKFPYQGWLDEIAIWDRGLNSTEINSYYMQSKKKHSYFEDEIRGAIASAVATDLLVLAKQDFKNLEIDLLEDNSYFIGNHVPAEGEMRHLTKDSTDLFLRIAPASDEDPGYVYLMEGLPQPPDSVEKHPLKSDIDHYFGTKGSAHPKKPNTFRWEVKGAPSK